MSRVSLLWVQGVLWAVGKGKPSWQPELLEQKREVGHSLGAASWGEVHGESDRKGGIYWERKGVKTAGEGTLVGDLGA